jgi:outer membrane protein OmpA-like peptidoglycan-associated protein
MSADTDSGTVNDGMEITNGTNPLEPADDIKKDEIKSEVGQAIVLEGVTFASGKSDISAESEETLTKVYNTLANNPDIEISIEGYTDNSGKKSSNIRLSQKRADAVKDYLVGKGIDGKRISTKGLGPDNPIAPNDTPENKQKNRRIEFKRTK